MRFIGWFYVGILAISTLTSLFWATVGDGYLIQVKWRHKAVDALLYAGLLAWLVVALAKHIP